MLATRDSSAHNSVEVRQHQRMLDKAISRAHFLGNTVNALGTLAFERVTPEVPEVSLSFRSNVGELLVADNPLEDNVSLLAPADAAQTLRY